MRNFATQNCAGVLFKIIADDFKLEVFLSVKAAVSLIKLLYYNERKRSTLQAVFLRKMYQADLGEFATGISGRTGVTGSGYYIIII